MKLSPNFSAALLASSLFKASATLFIDFLPREKRERKERGRERERERKRKRKREQ